MLRVSKLGTRPQGGTPKENFEFECEALLRVSVVSKTINRTLVPTVCKAKGLSVFDIRISYQEVRIAVKKSTAMAGCFSLHLVLCLNKVGDPLRAQLVE